VGYPTRVGRGIRDRKVAYLQISAENKTHHRIESLCLWRAARRKGDRIAEVLCYSFRRAAVLPMPDSRCRQPGGSPSYVLVRVGVVCLPGTLQTHSDLLGGLG
jgi:hypothetical protein